MANAATPPEGRDTKRAVANYPFGIFGSLEFKTNATTGMGQWTSVRQRMAKEQSLYSKCDAGDAACPAPLAAWRKNIKTWATASKSDQLSLVNSWVNQKIRYTDDKAVYKQADYWASPAQSLKGRGDCEDYAIAKYASLKALGFADDQLRIVIVNDTRKNIGHAILSVRTAQGIYILDNQNQWPMLHQKIAYYAPVSSFNANGRWINIATRQIKSQYNDAVVAKNDPSLAVKPLIITTVASGNPPPPPPDLRPSYAQAEIETLPPLNLRPTLIDTETEIEDRR